MSQLSQTLKPSSIKARCIERRLDALDVSSVNMASDRSVFASFLLVLWKVLSSFSPLTNEYFV